MQKRVENNYKGELTKLSVVIKIADSNVKEIYEYSDSGMKCFYNPKSTEITILPDFDNNPYSNEELWEEVIEEINSNFDKYIEFERMPSNEYFRMMEGFIEIIENPEVQKRLIYALCQPRPFHNFRYEIECSGDFRQKWFDFKEVKY